MAITANTLRPAAAWGGPGGLQAGELLEFAVFDAAIAVGDVLIFATSGDTHEVDELNDNAPFDAVIGVAAETVATTGDPIRIAPAFPGKLFEANLVTDGDTDEVGVAITNLGVDMSIIESNASQVGIACLSLGAGDTIAKTLFWARQQNVTQDADQQTGGVGISNPRTVFVFTTSVFNRGETGTG